MERVSLSWGLSARCLLVVGDFISWILSRVPNMRNSRNSRNVLSTWAKQELRHESSPPSVPSGLALHIHVFTWAVPELCIFGEQSLDRPRAWTLGAFAAEPKIDGYIRAQHYRVKQVGKIALRHPPPFDRSTGLREDVAGSKSNMVLWPFSKVSLRRIWLPPLKA